MSGSSSKHIVRGERFSANLAAFADGVRRHQFASAYYTDSDKHGHAVVELGLPPRRKFQRVQGVQFDEFAELGAVSEWREQQSDGDCVCASAVLFGSGI